MVGAPPKYAVLEWVYSLISNHELVKNTANKFQKYISEVFARFLVPDH